MRDVREIRLLATLVIGLGLAAWLYFAHPEWFNNRSIYSLPVAATASPLATLPPRVAPRPTPTPSTPGIGVTEHLDDIWITPHRVVHSNGAGGMLPNLGDEFLIVYITIRNRSQVDYPVRQSDFEVLDGHGEIDAPLAQNYTRMRLREVRLIPHGYIDGTLVFEAPQRDPAARLIYTPDTLDPTKRKEWLLR